VFHLKNKQRKQKAKVKRQSTNATKRGLHCGGCGRFMWGAPNYERKSSSATTIAVTTMMLHREKIFEIGQQITILYLIQKTIIC